MSFLRGILKGFSSGNAQIEFNKHETRDVERIEPYGFTAYPKKENVANVLFVGGDRKNGVVFMVEDGKKMKVEEGESAVYYDPDNYIYLKKDSTEIKRNDMTLTIDKDGKLNIKNGKHSFFKIMEALITELAGHQTPTMLGLQPTTSKPAFEAILKQLKEVLS